VFYSYARKDEESRKMLATCLAPLALQHKIEEWFDRLIEPARHGTQSSV